jgi:hypothetical protein
MAQDSKFPSPGDARAHEMLHRLAELVALSQHLSAEKVDRIVAAIEGQRDMVASLHQLTKDQTAMNEGIQRVGRAMGIAGFAAPPPAPSTYASTPSGLTPRS